jgi:hypothetical protein
LAAMSALSKAIIARELERVPYYPLDKFMTYNASISEMYRIPDTYKYSMEVTLFTKIVSGRDTLGDFFESAKKMITEAVFGEFRIIILEIKMNIYEKDLTAASENLDKLYKLMYEDL